MDAIRELPVDIKIHILRRIPPAKLVFVNRFFYYKYHELYILSKYSACFETVGAYQFPLLYPLKPHFELSYLQENIVINNNFSFSKKIVKIITESIKHDYIFLLSALFNDAGIVIKKIDSDMIAKTQFSKWMNLRTKNGCNIIRHKTLYPYMKYLCDLYNASIDIKNIIDVYYFNYFMKIDDCERRPNILMDISPILFGDDSTTTVEYTTTHQATEFSSYNERTMKKLRRKKKNQLKKYDTHAQRTETDHWGNV